METSNQANWTKWNRKEREGKETISVEICSIEAWIYLCLTFCHFQSKVYLQCQRTSKMATHKAYKYAHLPLEITHTMHRDVVIFKCWCLVFTFRTNISHWLKIKPFVSFQLFQFNWFKNMCIHTKLASYWDSFECECRAYVCVCVLQWLKGKINVGLLAFICKLLIKSRFGTLNCFLFLFCSWNMCVSVFWTCYGINVPSTSIQKKFVRLK